MAIWIEIHCDAQKEGSTPTGRPACYGLNGNQPGVLIQHISSVQTELRKLLLHCIAHGWIKKKGKIICPHCATYE